MKARVLAARLDAQRDAIGFVVTALAEAGVRIAGPLAGRIDRAIADGEYGGADPAYLAELRAIAGLAAAAVQRVDGEPE